MNLFLNFSLSVHGGSTQNLIIDCISGIGCSNYKITNVSGKSVNACVNCKNGCRGMNNCCFSGDIVKKVYDDICLADVVYFCYPVYLNMPPPNLMSLLSRLSMFNDNTVDRLLFNGKKARILVVSDVSGTQFSASCVMLALNMLGFDLPGRCVYEHVNNWQDNKIRGGAKNVDIRYLTKCEFKTRTVGENLTVGK